MAESKIKSRSHHDNEHLHPLPMSLPFINILYLMISEIKLGQAFYPVPHSPAQLDTMGETSTHTSLKGYRVTADFFGSKLIENTCIPVCNFFIKNKTYLGLTL